MIFKKKLLLLTLVLLIIFQTILFTNNSQRTSFRYLKWTIQDVSLGKLITISFFSGLFISALMNTTITGYKKITYENIEENYETLNNQEDTKSSIEMPPQRDIRDTQPTISVNYRVVKNAEENSMQSDQNFSNNSDNKDDWDKDDDDW